MSLSDVLFQTLYNDSTIQGLVTQVGDPPRYAVYPTLVLPEGVGLDNDSVTINFYGGLQNHALEYGERPFTVNCRSNIERTSRALANAVVNAVNRVKTQDTFFTAASLLANPPSDGTDNFNYIVEVLAKGQE